MWVGYEKQTIAIFRVEELVFDLLACGDISTESLQLDNFAIFDDQLHGLPDPYLAAIAGQGGKMK
ncbi:MAG: hypothetical protein H0U18_17600 [Pyrinomonadaceae bacterium]|nr:hypothetical protein [Pyrinomonadaceae bacterium]